MELKAMRTIITAVLLAALTIAGLGCGGGSKPPAPTGGGGTAAGTENTGPPGITPSYPKP
jgi:hypothetical protein